jgi:CheY-like chemotaxis protein
MAVTGEVFADVVCELNNLLAPACAHAELELFNLANDPSASHSELIGHRMRLAADLVSSVLQFTSPTAGGIGDVEQAIRAVLDLFSFHGRKGVRFEAVLHGPFPRVAVPSNHLFLVLISLVRDAIRNVEGSASPVVRVFASRTGRDVSVNVWHSAPADPSGVSPEPSADERAKGVGAAFRHSPAAKILAEVGGTVAATGAAEGGSSVVVTFPATGESSPARLPDCKPGPMPLNGRRILLVDDDDGTRQALPLVLSRIAGAVVDACASGGEALARLDATKFDAIILDLRMPGLSGQATFDRMPIVARSKVIFLTGDALGGATARFLASTQQPALIKPAVYEELVRAIRVVVENHHC